jgi:hypothetical protein
MGTYSFTEQMRKMGRVPKTTILDFELRGAPKHVASYLDMHIGEPVIRMKRLRWANDVPMMVETTYLPANEFVGLTQEELSTTPLYDLMEKTYHQTIRVAEEEFCASIAAPKRPSCSRYRKVQQCSALSHDVQRPQYGHRIYAQRCTCGPVPLQDFALSGIASSEREREPCSRRIPRP